MKAVSKAKDLEARVARLEQELLLFQKISRFMVRELGVLDILTGINSLIVEFMRCDSCLIYLAGGGELVLCSSNDPETDQLGQVRLRMGEGLTGWVAERRRMVSISRDAYRDERFKHFAGLPQDDFHAFLSAPIVARNRVVGVINVQHRHPHPHTGDEMELITTVGEQIGSLLVLARMDPQAVEQANHLELVFPEATRALG